MTSDVTLRELSGHEDYLACVALQKETWGQDLSEVVPPSILKISQRVGSVAAGAFDAQGRMLGFVFGLTGIDARGGPPLRLLHWSHMLAVKPEARDLHLGTRLKLYQRELLLPLGVEAVQWTYDPLEARNAHLNLNRLGAEVEEYVEEMYADEMGSELARGIGTDRFVVEWRIAGERVARALAGRPPAIPEHVAGAPVISPGGGPTGGELPGTPGVRVEIPENIQALKAENPDEAWAWRLSTRQAFEHYLSRGYRVAAFWRDQGRCFYGLTAPGA
jgi:predicted GNAT superfamily acetyltransferase